MVYVFLRFIRKKKVFGDEHDKDKEKDREKDREKDKEVKRYLPYLRLGDT